jgi:formylglycine-generating enzyme required for sulfatase activity
MSGNVWEWTSSPMAAYPGAPTLPDSLAQYRVIRGGAFDTIDSVATAWWRGYMKATSPASALPNTGFRCADNVAK